MSAFSALTLVEELTARVAALEKCVEDRAGEKVRGWICLLSQIFTRVVVVGFL